MTDEELSLLSVAELMTAYRKKEREAASHESHYNRVVIEKRDEQTEHEKEQERLRIEIHAQRQQINDLNDKLKSLNCLAVIFNTNPDIAVSVRKHNCKALTMALYQTIPDATFEECTAVIENMEGAISGINEVRLTKTASVRRIKQTAKGIEEAQEIREKIAKDRDKVGQKREKAKLTVVETIAQNWIKMGVPKEEAMKKAMDAITAGQKAGEQIIKAQKENTNVQ